VCVPSLEDRPWSRVEELLLKECRKEVTTTMMKVKREEAMGGREEREREREKERSNF
jgi:hypothetical protein